MAHELRMYVNEHVVLTSAVKTHYAIDSGTCVTVHAIDDTHVDLVAGDTVGHACLVVTGTVTHDEEHTEEVSDLMWVSVDTRAASMLGITWGESEPVPPKRLTATVQDGEGDTPPSDEPPAEDVPHVGRIRRPH